MFNLCCEKNDIFVLLTRTQQSYESKTRQHQNKTSKQHNSYESIY